MKCNNNYHNKINILLCFELVSNIIKPLVGLGVMTPFKATICNFTKTLKTKLTDTKRQLY